MNNELLLLIKKHKDKLFAQRKAKTQETIEKKLNKQTETFSFSPPINLPEEGKRLLAVRSFEATISVFSITDDNNSFLFTIPGHYNSKTAEKTIDNLLKLLELGSQNDIALHVKDLKKGVFDKK